MTTPIQTTQFDPMKFDAAAVTLQIRKIRQKIKEIETKHEEELKPFREFEAKRMGEMIAFLQATHQDSAKNVNGTPYLTVKVTYSVQDLQEFRRHVIGTESWDLLTWGCAKTAADTFIEMGATIDTAGKKHLGPPPPGVKRTAMITLGVLAPTKPKTATVASPPPQPGTDEYEDARQQEVETL
jgi:hypothetical protein